MNRVILYAKDARAALKKGIDAVANAVKTTLGPRGRTVLISMPAGPGLITKDGVTVARSVHLPDPLENEGAKLCIEVATKSNIDAGDGTTTSVVLAQQLTRTGLEAMEKGANPVRLARGIDQAVEQTVRYIEAQARPVASSKEIEWVASISGNDPEIGRVLAEAMDQVGKDGVITLEAGGTETKVSITDGYEFGQGWAAPHFANTHKGEAVYENCLVLVAHEKFKLAQQAVQALEQCAKAQRPLLVICEDVDDEALTTFVMNRVQGALPVVVVKAPYFGQKQVDTLDDIAVFCGAQFICPAQGIDPPELKPEMLGTCKQVIVGPNYCILREGAGDVTERVEQLRALIADGHELDTLKYQERCAKLTQGLAVIQIGAATDVEQKEKRHRFEDALNATRAAVKEGIVPGGGWTLLQAAKNLKSSTRAQDKDEALGINLVREALKGPAWQIAENAGFSGDEVIRKRQGFNAETGKHGELLKQGVVDPALVTKSAVRNAASIVKYVLLTECLNVLDTREKS